MYTYVHTCMQMSLFVDLHKNFHLHMYKFMCKSRYRGKLVNMYIYSRTYMYIHVYMYVYACSELYLCTYLFIALHVEMHTLSL